jgi:glycerol uptake facilitator-like aquaporin
MANKKATSGTTKSTVIKPSTTKVTTVKAVESRVSGSRRSEENNSFLYKLTSTPLLAASLAEFVGTFLLTAIILTQQNQPIAVFFALVGITLAIGTLSGAHINPVATVGSWMTKHTSSVKAVAFLIAQVLGAMLALVVLNAFLSHAPATPTASDMSAMGQSGPSLFKAAAIPKDKEWVLLFAELLGTTILGLGYAAAVRNARDKVTSALTVAGSYFTALVVAGTVATYVSASVVLNPAAAIAVEALNFNTVWPVAIYVFVSLLGGVIGFALYDLLLKAERNVE